MKKNITSLARALPALFLCFLCLIPTAYADFGPKPSLTITVINAPETELYLDLLAEGGPVDHVRASSEQQYDPAILSSLRTLEGNGWVLACSSGLANSHSPSGDLLPRQGRGWSFGYWIPSPFRIAAATADHAQASEAFTTRGMISHIIYDWETNTVTEALSPPGRFAVRLSTTLAITLAVEGIILFLFKFRQKRTWLVFFSVNAVTQTLLHIVCGPVTTVPATFVSDLTTLLIAELVIWVTEAAAYALLLRERTPLWRIAYALCANPASFLMGIPAYLIFLLFGL